LSFSPSYLHTYAITSWEIPIRLRIRTSRTRLNTTSFDSTLSNSNHDTMTPIKPAIVAGLHILATAASLVQASPTLAFDRTPILELQLPRINLQKGLRYVNRTLSVARLDALSNAADGAFWEHPTSNRLGFIHSRPAEAARSIASTTRSIRPWTLNAADFAQVEAIIAEGDDMEKWQLFSYLGEMQAQYAAVMEFGMRRLHRKIAEEHQKGVELHQKAIELSMEALRLEAARNEIGWYTSCVAFLVSSMGFTWLETCLPPVGATVRCRIGHPCFNLQYRLVYDRTRRRLRYAYDPPTPSTCGF
jgi:hypothetical protein